MRRSTRVAAAWNWNTTARSCARVWMGKTAWCERRLLARIHRYDDRKTAPARSSRSAPREFLQFLACWQHVDEEYRLEGPRGVAEVLAQLAGFEVPAWAWEAQILPRRVRDYRREWLDEVTMSGEFAWGRLWGSAASAIRVTPIAIVPREQLDDWLALAEEPTTERMSGPASRSAQAAAAGGPMFPQNLPKAANLVPAHVEMGLAELLARGLVTCDSFAAVRQMITPPSRRRRCRCRPGAAAGCLLSGTRQADVSPASRTVRRTDRDDRPPTAPPHGRRLPPHARPRKDSDHLVGATRVYRRMELRGEIRGGRFVAGFSGEQFALPEAVELLRRLRRQGPRQPISVCLRRSAEFPRHSHAGR